MWGLWAAVAPGAGFSETPEFLKVWQKEVLKPTPWEIKLWHLYDATDYAVNFYNTPLVAYSGEIDGQKQAADMMAKAMAAEGMRMTHIIGPGTAHKYHPDAKVTINGLLDSIAERGRDPYPRKVRFTTWTLAYNRMKWVQIDGLGRHWERARLDAAVVDDHTVEVKSSNVTAFTLEMGAGGCPLDDTRKPVVDIDGQRVTAAVPESDRFPGRRISSNPRESGPPETPPPRPGCTSGMDCKVLWTTRFSTASSSCGPRGLLSPRESPGG